MRKYRFTSNWITKKLIGNCGNTAGDEKRNRPFVEQLKGEVVMETSPISRITSFAPLLSPTVVAIFVFFLSLLLLPYHFTVIAILWITCSNYSSLFCERTYSHKMNVTHALTFHADYLDSTEKLSVKAKLIESWKYSQSDRQLNAVLYIFGTELVWIRPFSCL